MTFVALAGFLLWLPAGADKALDVAAALLVVTCPCAIGIALPLAYELTFQRLRRAGAFVRARRPARPPAAGAPHPLRQDRHADARPARARRARGGRGAGRRGARRRLRSRGAVDPPGQPRARHRARAARERAFDATARGDRGARRRRRGALRRRRSGGSAGADWATTGGAASDAGAVLSRDGAPLARFATREVLRPDAQRELGAARGAGLRDLARLGRRPGARRAAGRARSASPPERAVGGLSPEEKAAARGAARRRATRSISATASTTRSPSTAAYAAGTPAIDRPVMPGRSDFFLVGEGLAPLAEMLAGARRLRRAGAPPARRLGDLQRRRRRRGPGRTRSRRWWRRSSCR